MDWLSTPCRRILGGRNVYLENNAYDKKMSVSERIMTLFISLVVMPIAVVSFAIKLLSFPCLWDKETVVKTWNVAEDRIQKEEAQRKADETEWNQISDAFTKAFSEKRYDDYINLALQHPSIRNDNSYEYNHALKCNTAQQMIKPLKTYLDKGIEKANVKFIMHNFIERLEPDDTFDTEFYWKNVFFPEALNFWAETDPVKKVQMAALAYELMTLIAEKVHDSNQETTYQWRTVSESEHRAFWIKNFIDKSYIDYIKTSPKFDKYNADIQAAMNHENGEQLKKVSQFIKAYHSLSKIQKGSPGEVKDQIDQILTEEINQWMDEIEEREDYEIEQEENDPFGYRIPDEKSPLEKMEMEYYTKIDELLFELNPEEISLED